LIFNPKLRKREKVNTTTENTVPTIWDLYESPRKGAEETTALFEWSRNWAAGKGPATVFLALIGYGEEEYGEVWEMPQGVTMGYLELDYIADALKEYASDPQRVSNAVTELLEAEMNQ
jgi:hypothetical protein